MTAPALEFKTIKELPEVVEITQDELILSLIRNHTKITGRNKIPSNIIRFFVLLAHGSSIRQAAKQTGINDRTVRIWKNQEWFNVVLDAVVQQLDSQLDKQLTGVIHKGVQGVADRMEDGDYVFNKKGELVRKPMGGRDMAITTAVMFDKRQLLRDKPTLIEQKSADERLSDLGERFRQFAAATEIDGNAEVEVEEVDTDD